LIGFVVFGVTSALCGLSQDVYQLIAYRMLQGAGASVLIAMGVPLIVASFPPKERGMAIGVQSIAYGIGSATGPVLGGALTAIDWRLIFYINVPIAIAAIAVGKARIPGGLNPKEGVVARLNFLNALVLAVAISLVILWLTFLDARIAFFAALGVAAFFLAESKSSNPLLDRELLKSRGFVYSVLGLGLLFASFAGVVFVMSFYFQSIAGFSPLTAGIWIAPLSIGLAAANPIAGRLFDRMRRPSEMSIAAAIVASCSLLILSWTISLNAPGIAAVILLAMIGFGRGLEWTPTITSVLKFSKLGMRGVASGTAYTVVQIAFATSIAIVVSLSTLTLPSALAGQIRSGSVGSLNPADAVLFDQGLSRALQGLAVLGLAALPFFFLMAREQGRHVESATEIE
jgi:predicted MFS family arabinose efflux permease